MFVERNVFDFIRPRRGRMYVLTFFLQIFDTFGVGQFSLFIYVNLLNLRYLRAFHFSKTPPTSPLLCPYD
jgi:hypothetical protein